ncbi:MAG: 2-amino-4-hydroxy-6-hydroxymethyldihydropteridine diphosphokinase [Paludibacteraceae bacterium]|nr:2-amino-4-hydroxy-6-hydroxymethyldihydropteridine diphosphokinase [Paludibacteraceae bacterium]
MPTLYLGLGSNMGDRKKMITDATMICGTIMGNLVNLSSLYETEPWGFSSPNKFLNAAICIETEHSPEKCLAMAKAIEREMGRMKHEGAGYEDRPIDIDILFYDDLVMNSETLTIPHPLIQNRDFVLRPLAEIAPDLTHPVFGKSIEELLIQWEKNN